MKNETEIKIKEIIEKINNEIPIITNILTIQLLSVDVSKFSNIAISSSNIISVSPMLF